MIKFACLTISCDFLTISKLLKIFPIGTEWSALENSCLSFWISKEDVKSSVKGSNVH